MYMYYNIYRLAGYMRDVLHWIPIKHRIENSVAALVWRCIIGLTPTCLIEHCRATTSRPTLESAERHAPNDPHRPHCNNEVSPGTVTFHCSVHALSPRPKLLGLDYE